MNHVDASALLVKLSIAKTSPMRMWNITNMISSLRNNKFKCLRMGAQITKNNNKKANSFSMIRKNKQGLDKVQTICKEWVISSLVFCHFKVSFKSRKPGAKLPKPLKIKDRFWIRTQIIERNLFLHLFLSSN